MKVKSCEEMIGKKYGMLTVDSQGVLEKRGNSMAMTVFCTCECGTKCKRFACLVRSTKDYKVTSCGCLRKEAVAAIGRGRTSHGKCTKENMPYFNRWKWVLARCEDKRIDAYKKYGARGISVCERWHDFWLFRQDVIKMEEESGRKISEGYTIDRIDGTKNYDPDNCRLLTQSEQCRNLRTNKRVDGVIFADIESETGFSHRLVSSLAKQGMSLEEIRKYRPQIHKSYMFDGKITSIPEMAKMISTTSGSLRWHIRTKGLKKYLLEIGKNEEFISKFSEGSTESRYLSAH